MTDKEFEKEQKRVKLFLRKWQKPLGFNWWGISHDYFRTPIDGHEEAVAVTSTQWEYRNAWIRWCVPKTSTLTDEELEECVVHELCHILIGSIEGYDEKMNARTELATTNIQRAIAWAYKAGQNDPRR